MLTFVAAFGEALVGLGERARLETYMTLSAQLAIIDILQILCIASVKIMHCL